MVVAAQADDTAEPIDRGNIDCRQVVFIFSGGWDTSGPGRSGAGGRDRTDDIQLGKLTFYL